MGFRLFGLFTILPLFFGMMTFTNAQAIEDSVIVGDFPRDIELDPILNNLYVPNYESGTVSVIDANSMIIKDTIIINEQNSHPTQIVVDENRHLVFLSDKISGKLTVIDGTNGEIISSKEIGESLWELEINKDNGKLYVSDLINNEIIIVDTENFEIIKSIPVSSSPWDVEINQNTNTIYVATGTSEIIYVINGNTDSIVNEINPGMKPWGLSINEKKGLLYATSWDSSKIIAIDLQNEQILYEIPVLSGVWQMTTNQNNGVTVIANEHANELCLLDEDSRQFQKITVLDSPQSITTSPISNIIYVTNPLSNSASSLTYEYNHSVHTPIIENIISDNYSINDELLLEVIDGISNIPQREDFDKDMISGLLQNLGVTGEFDGNGIARILLDDYNEKKELQPKTTKVPSWTTEIAMMFTDDLGDQSIPQEINCDDDSFSPINDIDNVNTFEIWIKILPICALS